jgi:hypothetical protein
MTSQRSTGDPLARSVSVVTESRQEIQSFKIGISQAQTQIDGSRELVRATMQFLRQTGDGETHPATRNAPDLARRPPV